MRAELNCWGPYRSAIDERLAACDDYLGRLGRSLAGEIAHDQFYFVDKARSLRDAAQALVDGVDDVVWWLDTCTAELPDNGECGLATGHRGAHQPAAACREYQILSEARAVAEDLRAVNDGLARGLRAIRAGAGGGEPGALAAQLRRVERRLALAARSVESLAAAPEGEGEDGS